MKYKIEHNVPVPPGRGLWSSFVSEMTPGDSVLVDTRKEAAAFSYALRRSGHRPAIRKENGKYRVWHLGKLSKRNK